MFTMAVGQSDDVDPQTAVAEAIKQCRVQLGERRPKAGIFFCAIDAFQPELIKVVRDAFGGIDIIGASSAAEVSSMAGFLEDSVALALFAPDADVTTGVALATGLDNGIDSSVSAALNDALENIAPNDVRLCILLADPAPAQLATEAINSMLPNALVVGGGAGRNELGTLGITYQFCNDQVETNGAAMLLLAGDIAVSSAVGTGWTVLGPSGIVTRADYGLIHEIDGRPAAEYLRGYVDVSGHSAPGNPLAVRDPGSQDWYLRVVLAADERGALYIPGGITVGATVQLTMTSPQQMLVAAADAVGRARGAFPSDAKPSAALIFSCAVRKYMLGSRSDHELSAAKAGLPPDLPIAGMYCMGEIAPTGDALASHYLNETFVTVLLGD